MQAAQAIQNFLNGFIRDHGLNFLIIVLVLWLAGRLGKMLIGRFIRRFVHPTHFKLLAPIDVKKRQDTLISMFGALWSVSVWVVAIIMIIQEIGIQTAPLLASAGILSIALGFGAQSIVKDFFSGIFIILENQYRVGDIVDLDGSAGTVEHITIRSTVLRDTDGNVHYVPNGSITRVINKTMGYSLINLTIAVAADTDVDDLARAINRVGRKMTEDKDWGDKILEAPRFLSIGSFSDLAMEVKIVGKTQPSEQWAVTGELRRRLLQAFHRQGIVLAQLLPGALLQPPAGNRAKPKP